MGNADITYLKDNKMLKGCNTSGKKKALCNVCMSVLIWNKWFSNNSFKLLFIKSIKGLLIAMGFFLVAGMLWS